MNIQFFWCPRTRSARVAWMLNETGVDYDVVEINIRDKASKENEDFQRASPMGKVPAIAVGDASLADSAAICIYLADRFALGKLAPELDDPARAKYLFWMTFVPGVLEPAMAEKIGGHEPNPASFGWGSFPIMIQTLESALERGPWLLGEWFTAADVIVGSSVVSLQVFGMLPESPVLEAYAKRCLEREAYQKALAMEPPPDA